MKQDKEVLNLIEAAEFLSTSPRTLQKAVAEGSIPCRRLGKRYFFALEALRNWLMGR